MIEINLVPIHLRKKDNRGVGEITFLDIPKEVFLGVGGVFVFLLLVVHISLIVLWTTKLSQHTLLEVTWKSMLPDKNNIDGIGKELKELRAELIKVKDLTSKKNIQWSEKLNIISDVIPKEVWLKKMFWNNKQLTMEGSVVSKTHSEIVVAGNFVSNLKKEDAFIKDFLSIELNSVNRGRKGEIDVVDFTITSNAK